MSYKDPAARRENHRLYMQERFHTDTKFRTRHMKAVKANQRRMAQWLWQQKLGRTCSRCSESHPACLDFHHRDPELKTVSLSAAARRKSWGPERMLQEIAKCDLICANCHRKEHWLERSDSYPLED